MQSQESSEMPVCVPWVSCRISQCFRGLGVDMGEVTC